MTALQHASLMTLYLGAAVLSGMTLARYHPGLSANEGYAIGLFFLALGVLLQCSLARVLPRLVSARHIYMLDPGSSMRLTDGSVAPRLAGATLGGEASSLAADGRAQDVNKVIAEVKVLQSLVEQLYDRRKTDTATLARPGQPVAATAVAAKPDGPQGESNGFRAPTLTADAAAAPVPAAEAAKILEGEAGLDILRESLRKGHVELALQPIVSLPQRKRRFYEAFSRVRVGDGLFLLPHQYISLAERAGLITAIDNTLLFRCIQLVRKARGRDLDLGFFCNISQHTLADRAFFHEFVRFMRSNAELAPNIIFEFPQRAITAIDDKLRRDLVELGRMGFRFSLDQVNDLQLDIGALCDLRFRFVKIDAARLLASGTQVMPAALKRRLDAAHIDLIVEKIESEPVLVELLDLKIDFGQGYLFGEPRLSRLDG